MKRHHQQLVVRAVGEATKEEPLSPRVPRVASWQLNEKGFFLSDASLIYAFCPLEYLVIL